MRECQRDRAKEKIAKPSSMKTKHANDPARFAKRYMVTEDDELAKKDVYFLIEEAIAEEARYDGFYAVCTNL